MVSSAEVVGLTVAGALGGAINAVAGGGTLITFPALLFFGTAPLTANATSTVALVIGTSGGLYGFRNHLNQVRVWLWRFLPSSILGGLLGGVLLTWTSNRTFSRLVPFLILFATILFLLQTFLKPQTPDDTQEVRNPVAGRQWLAILFQFLVAVYGGYFGAGIGILMLASLGFLGLGNIHQMNTLKTLLGSIINLVAAVWFVVSGLVDWPRAGLMTAGAVVGYYLGAHYSQKISQRAVRQLITGAGLLLSAVTFYKEFVK
jgi:uncharacterized membrane protein YfcA